jgi:Cdc6-like AAA superfamily ATPase
MVHQRTGNETWLEVPNSKLWVYGISGAGKTVLAAAVLEEVIPSSSPEYAVACYYCDYKVPKTQQLSSVLAPIAGQLARQHEACFTTLQQDYRPKAGQATSSLLPTVKDLTVLVERLAQQFSDVAIVVDGVDECQEPSEVANALVGLVDRCSQLRMLVSSRDERTIRCHSRAWLKILA